RAAFEDCRIGRLLRKIQEHRIGIHAISDVRARNGGKGAVTRLLPENIDVIATTTFHMQSLDIVGVPSHERNRSCLWTVARTAADAVNADQGLLVLWAGILTDLQPRRVIRDRLEEVIPRRRRDN